MNKTFTKRSESIEPFQVMALLARANELQAEGKQVIHLEIGEPDFTTAEPILEAAKAAIDAGYTQYTPALGLPALRKEIAKLYKIRYNLDIDYKRILITPGGSGALLLVSGLLVEAGQHLLMADPGYPCNRNFLRLVEADAKMIPTDHTSNYQLTPKLLEQHWDNNTAGILVASPANPTGTILNKDELAALAKTCQQHQGYFISDEIYHGLTYGVEAPSALEVDDNAYILNSFSKYYGMTGWRLGWLVAPLEAVDSLEKFAQNVYISATSVSQYAALACFKPETQTILEARRAEFAKRRDFLLPALTELGFKIKTKPDGAFYLYADVSAFTDDAYKFCYYFLENQHVAFTPGLDFGNYHSNQHVRFAYTQSLPVLEEAVNRIARGLQNWQG
ncbi:pyridoxal phosphate-dependent aminotransferase [Entomomonas sp. E2T0]|uniref:pyridoxal phosphate-dependent aminotransferase n=1 Tax=Entomomonas sp. E2T0 TaxID=2930213 RepID=UPI0022282E7D|nr:pyridoxal phosphate-dependent aminotransferase [Entomomonas sp. E2T0]UYZ84078.1 pyridoxal phosphate-dependent aminotransferase [Entomomonas sp. E2T0]